MRVVIIAGGVPATTFIDALVNAMAEEGLEMVVIGKKKRAYQYHKNVRVVEIPRNKLLQLLFILRKLVASRFKHFRELWKNKTNLKDFFYDVLFYTPIIAAKPDKIHLQWVAHIENKELLFDFFKDKIQVSLRGSHINDKPIIQPGIKEVYKRLFPKVVKFHAVCDAIGEEATKYGAEAGRIQTIYSYVKDDLLQKEISLKESDVLRIVSIGRFIWKKGYDYALDAMSILKEQGVAFQYTLIAQGSIPDAIIFQIHQLGLEDQIKIINGLPHHDILQAVEENDILLLPSVEEGIANVVLEAMAAGTPVISTDCGGMNEVIIDSVNGFLVEIRDSKMMADALINFNRLSSDQRFNIARNAKTMVQKYHSSGMFKSKFLEFYQN